jgi:hypothetical protein
MGSSQVATKVSVEPTGVPSVLKQTLVSLSGFVPEPEREFDGNPERVVRINTVAPQNSVTAVTQSESNSVLFSGQFIYSANCSTMQSRVGHIYCHDCFRDDRSLTASWVELSTFK